MSNCNKYATLDFPGAKSFAIVAREIEKEGHNLTPARTRLVVLQSLEKIVRKVGKEYGKPLSRDKAKEIVREPDFQNEIAPLIQRVYLEQENKY